VYSASVRQERSAQADITLSQPRIHSPGGGPAVLPLSARNERGGSRGEGPYGCAAAARKRSQAFMMVLRTGSSTDCACARQLASCFAGVSTKVSVGGL
jgi:hypothetical protein